MRMSPSELDKNVPIGRNALATRPPPGDLNHEPERTETIDGDGGRDGGGADAGAGGGADGGGCRQSQRIWKRHPADGDAGLVPRRRGQRGASPQAGASAMARAQAVLWRDGATGRVA